MNPRKPTNASSTYAAYAAYAIKPFRNQDGELIDLAAIIGGREIRMLGPAGAERELAMAEAFKSKLEADSLPVFLGSGMGCAISKILNETNLPVAVVEKESTILQHTGLAEKLAAFGGRLTFITPSNSENPQETLNRLTRWQSKHMNRPFAPVLHPFYLKLGEEIKDYYSFLNNALKASRSYNFWEKIRYPRFKQNPPRILLITRQYFLIGEIIEACQALDVPFRLLQVGTEELAQEEFVEELLKAVLEFKPDFIFTINHLGIDREGLLMELLSQLELPLASWFVDNPHLILYKYQGLASPWATIFTWDADNVASLQAEGFKQVYYLPLATTPERFARTPSFKIPEAWSSEISFVGNSMQYKVQARLEAAAPGPELLAKYKEIAAGFARHNERSVLAYLELEYPDLLPAYETLKSTERKLAFETMITWEATRQYRDSCVEQILPFNPLILGDDGWELSFGSSPHRWRWHSEISYYDELPFFYPNSLINFNCTSKQMKGAVNQRVFDVPAAGAFLLTDWREQMDRLFEPGKEVVFFEEPDEIPELVRFYRNNQSARGKIMNAARKRILAHHTYALRLQEIIAHMRRIYG